MQGPTKVASIWRVLNPWH